MISQEKNSSSSGHANEEEKSEAAPLTSFPQMYFTHRTLYVLDMKNGAAWFFKGTHFIQIASGNNSEGYDSFWCRTSSS